jgi:hypothetical protein
MNKKIRRINLFGGPGVGKSTISAYLFYDLKMDNKHVELVQEYVKGWAYEGRVPIGWDQLHLFTEQLRREELLLRNGVDLIISDSPIFLAACYGKKNRVPVWRHLLKLAACYEAKYPSFNVFLKRGANQFYEALGRYQTEEEARKMDDYVRRNIRSFGVRLDCCLDATLHNEIRMTVRRKLGW